MLGSELSALVGDHRPATRQRGNITDPESGHRHGTPTGKLMLTMIRAIATFEREIMLEQQAEGIALAKTKGSTRAASQRLWRSGTRYCIFPHKESRRHQWQSGWVSVCRVSIELLVNLELLGHDFVSSSPALTGCISTTIQRLDFEMKKIAILFSVALMTACSSSSSSSSASLPVKVIDAKAAESCKLIDVVSGTEIFSLTVDKNVALARQNAANEAIKLGANAVVITGTDVTANGNSATVTMNAYSCN